MAPYATMILALPSLLFEGAGVVEWLYTFPSVVSSMLLIFLSGVLAFFLNFSIFYVIHSTTAVTFNVKVAVAVTFSWMIFQNPISAMNALGCGVTLVGCTFYGYVRHILSQHAQESPENKMEFVPLVHED
ncbi:hypothetical protein R3W88_029330 [Solanum pinnatisectum]|uniref:Sugar phosphate transporter domain-containing protein n=1 Tax=Solanum pinnatisectum TaxID=50273 RepID=A0AAV9K6R3_9SOLN|nr:hypothetical protein R3W88_029330 [Solanum pinnatisectum]